MNVTTFPRAITLSPDVAERRAARKQVIEKARQRERESYKAMMQKRRQLHASSRLDRIT